jgi:hypothetical protein
MIVMMLMLIAIGAAHADASLGQNSDRRLVRLDHPRRDRGDTQGLAEPLRPCRPVSQVTIIGLTKPFRVNLAVRKSDRRSGCHAVTKRRRGGECSDVRPSVFFSLSRFDKFLSYPNKKFL